MAAMSKTNAFFGEPQAGQPVTVSAMEPVQQTAQQSDLETLINAALAKSLPTVIDQALEKVSRSQQSQRDKMESRINERLNSTIAMLKASGVEVTQDLHTAIKQQVTSDERNQTQPQHSDLAQGTAQPGAGLKFDKFALRDEVFELYGEKLEANDPEAQNFQDSDDPAELIRNLKQAIKAKQARLKGEAQGRLGVVPSGGGVSKPTAEQYKTEMFAARGKPVELRKIKEKYQAAGINVDSISLFK